MMFMMLLRHAADARAADADAIHAVNTLYTIYCFMSPRHAMLFSPLFCCCLSRPHTTAHVTHAIFSALMFLPTTLLPAFSDYTFHFCMLRQRHICELRRESRRVVWRVGARYMQAPLVALLQSFFAAAFAFFRAPLLIADIFTWSYTDACRCRLFFACLTLTMRR